MGLNFEELKQILKEQEEQENDGEKVKKELAELKRERLKLEQVKQRHREKMDSIKINMLIKKENDAKAKADEITKKNNNMYKFNIIIVIMLIILNFVILIVILKNF